MVRLLTFAFGLVIALVAVALSLSPDTIADEAAPVEGASLAGDGKPGTARTGADDTEITRDPAGKFHLGAVVNGEDARFLLDTGADVVALTVDDAERFGIAIDRENFKQIADTASGPGYGAPIRIDHLEIAGQEFRDVDAVVIDGLQVNLLGQSMLGRLGQMEVRGDKMILRRS